MNINRQCLFVKNLPSMIDLEASDSTFKMLNSHKNNCSICKDEFAKIIARRDQLQLLIPEPKMDNDLKDSFRRELHLFLKDIGLNQFENRKKKWWQYLSFFDHLLQDLVSVILSKKILTLILLTAIIYYYFNNF